MSISNSALRCCFSCSACPKRGCIKCPEKMEHLHVRGLPSDCVECPEKSKKREGEEVLEMDLVIDDEE